MTKFHLLLLFYMTTALACYGQLPEDEIVPESRLQALSPMKPVDYRDLAEELSVVENSRRAKDLTIRLYLICAKHSSGPLRRSALRGLIASARSDDEKKNFIILAYHQDSLFSRELLEINEPKQMGQSMNQSPDDGVRKRLLDSLRSLRQGKFAKAKKIMAEVSVQKLMASYYPEFSIQEYNKVCDSETLTDAALLATIELDWKIRGTALLEGKSPHSHARLQKWTKALTERLPPRNPDIRFETVTEFNPQQSVYLNGFWTLPKNEAP